MSHASTATHPSGPARLAAGLALCALLASVSVYGAGFGWFSAHGVSALTLAIVIGMVIGNTLFGRIAAPSGPGVAFAKQRILRFGIVLYGLRLTLRDVGAVGVGGLLVDAIIVTSTFGLGWLIGTRVLGMNRASAMLIGVGSAICGAAAVLAAEPIVRGRAEQVSVAVATVVVFGTVGIFLYPALYSQAGHWPLLAADPRQFGIYVGSTVHEVAQVVAAGRAISPAAADAAVITKMVRVMMLAPFLIGLSAWLARDPAHQAAHGSDGHRHGIAIPWFAIGFIVMVLVNSLDIIPPPVRAAGIQVDTFALAMAMSALGLTTHVRAIRDAGAKPLLLALALFAWLVLGGAAINRLFNGLAG